MDLATLAETLTSSVIGALIALAIGAVGYVIAAFNESRRWQRQQRVIIYTKIAKHHKMIDRKLGELSTIVKISLKTCGESENIIEKPKAIQYSRPQSEQRDSGTAGQRDSVSSDFSELNKELTGMQA